MKFNFDEIVDRTKGLKDFTRFNKESERLGNLILKLLESKDEEYNKVLSEWFIIRLVILWEYHFKSLIISLIDDSGFQYEEEVKISLKDLERIQKTRDISAGKIFVSTKGLQNFETVEKIMSSLLKIKFSTELKKKYGNDIDIKSVKACLEKRHQIVHEMKEISFSKDEIKNYAVSMMLFMINSSIFCNNITSKKPIRY